MPSLRRIAGALAAVAVFALASCANTEPVLPHSATPEPGVGYIAGDFSRTQARQNAFVIKSLDSPRMYTMTMGQWGVGKSSAFDDTVAIAVVPGRYVLWDWTADGTSTRSGFGGSAEMTFDVRAGEVVHLGRWEIYEVWLSDHQTGLHIKVQPTTRDEMHESFAWSYKALADLPFECLCLRNYGQ